MLRVGVTGGIGSGKTTVCRILEVLGVPVFYADVEAKELFHDATVRNRIQDVFGKKVVRGNTVDRKALAATVFNDAVALHKLNAIIHPAVRERFDSWVHQQHANYVVQEAAILVETGAYMHFDHLVVVSCPEEERIKRIIARDGASREEVLARMSNQASEKVRNSHADTVIDNSGDVLVIPQMLALHEHLIGVGQ